MKTAMAVLAAVVVCAVAAQAGEVAAPAWPGGSDPEDVCTIPVVMEMPWWTWIRNLDQLVIRLLPRSAHEYEGCVDVVFGVHRGLNVATQFIPTGAVAGTYSCILSSSNLAAQENTLGICVKLKTEVLPPATTNLWVGTVRLKISPRL